MAMVPDSPVEFATLDISEEGVGFSVPVRDVGVEARPMNDSKGCGDDMELRVTLNKSPSMKFFALIVGVPLSPRRNVALVADGLRIESSTAHK
jgi:hypothetical protein